jgi:transformation/transcription domain-associated protein
MVEGMISRLCPIGPISLRKELLVATRHILATELRSKYISSIDLIPHEATLRMKRSNLWLIQSSMLGNTSS